MVDYLILGCSSENKVYSCAEVYGNVIDCETIVEDIRKIIKGDKHEYKI